VILLYSDGIIDQPDLSRDRFGTSRFTAILNENISESMPVIKSKLERAFDEHKGLEEQRDDVTVLGLRLN